MNGVPYVEEHIRFLVSIQQDDPKFMEKYHYICGLLDAYGRTMQTTEGAREVDRTWESFAYAVSSKLNLPAYFALRHKAEDTPGALERYTTDLHKLDFMGIVKDPAESFVFILRDLGTHISWIKYNSWREKVEGILQVFGSGCLYIGYWDAETSKLIDLGMDTWEADLEAHLKEKHAYVPMP